MYCPFCSAEETKVIDSRLVNEGIQVRRRRECLKCQERFTTFERAELNLPRVIKRDGRRNVFDEKKLRLGLLKALEKRPISMVTVDKATQRIIHQLRASGEREVHAHYIGELVMDELQQLDEVAYVRFASVYEGFQDIDAFRHAIRELLAKRKKSTDGHQHD